MAKKKNNNEQKFNQTDYGKKLKKNMIIWTIIFIIGLIIETVLFSTKNDTLMLISDILGIVNWLIFGISFYHDGKYSGALEMYNKRLK